MENLQVDRISSEEGVINFGSARLFTSNKATLGVDLLNK